jgi:hypothetical protein
MRWPAGVDPEALGARLLETEETDVPALYRALLGGAPRWVIWWRAVSLYFHLGAGFNQPGDLEPLGMRACPPLIDWLHCGPQNVDLSVQARLRDEYWQVREESYDPEGTDRKSLDSYARALASGNKVIFWCNPELGSCLGILWALDALHQRGADFRNAALLLWPAAGAEWIGEPEARRAFEQLIPVREVLEPLIAVRRHIASDSDTVEADLSTLPPSVREWAAVTNHMVDYLPDERGLDVPDGHLLNLLTEEWQSGRSFVPRFPHPREPGWGLLWDERLLELSDSGPSTDGASKAGSRLVEAAHDSYDFAAHGRFRITELGRRVRAGEEDALAHVPLRRWVGGRLITNARPLRRQGRKPTDRGLSV